MHFIQQLNHWLWPNYCVICRNLISRHIPLCTQCEKELPWNLNACTCCGNPFAHSEVTTTLCGQCLSTPPAYQTTIAPLIYRDGVTKLIIHLKFYHRLQYAHLLGHLFANFIRKNMTPHILPEKIIPIPLHKKRIQKRGFNQSLEIAKVVARDLQIPLDYHICCRKKNTQPQTSLAAKERHANIKNAFTLIKQSAKVHHVAIFDDVVTTGHTVNELSKVLVQGGIKRVDVWCCARAPIII